MPPEKLSRKILSIVLSIIGLQFLVFFNVHYQTALYWGSLHGEVSGREWVIASIKYVPAMLIIGVLMLWGASKLWSRWRLGMGVVALIQGLGLALEAFQVLHDNHEVPFGRTFALALTCGALLEFVVGAGLLLWHTKRGKGLSSSREAAVVSRA